MWPMLIKIQQCVLVSSNNNRAVLWNIARIIDTLETLRCHYVSGCLGFLCEEKRSWIQTCHGFISDLVTIQTAHTTTKLFIFKSRSNILFPQLFYSEKEEVVFTWIVWSVCSLSSECITVYYIIYIYIYIYNMLMIYDTCMNVWYILCICSSLYVIYTFIY